MALTKLRTVSKIHLDTLVMYERNTVYPRQKYTREYGVEFWLDPASYFEQNFPDAVCPAEYVGFGWFPEAENHAEFDEDTQKLGPRDEGTVDTELNLFIYQRAAVDLTQAELDAKNEAAAQAKKLLVDAAASDNQEALIRRKAATLKKQGKEYESITLLLSKGLTL